MRFLVDANVLSEATRPVPDPRVLAWLVRHEREVVAATALVYGLPVATLNWRHFEMAGVEIIDPSA